MGAFADQIIHLGRQLVSRAASEQVCPISFTPSLWLNSVRVVLYPETIPPLTSPRTPCDYGLSNYVRVLHYVLHISAHPSIFFLPSDHRWYDTAPCHPSWQDQATPGYRRGHRRDCSRSHRSVVSSFSPQTVSDSPLLLVMGRIPNFTNTIFPKDSLVLLALTSNIGITLFLFLVGLEVDVRLMKRNTKSAALVSALGLIVPLGLGAAIAVPLYHTFISDTVNFGYFILFVAVAVGITAFPVLCRILTELKLLDTSVGLVVLAAGVGNDVIGWVLLALTVALVNASGGLTALYVLLVGIGYVIFMLWPVKWAFRFMVKKSGSLATGQPTTLVMTVTLLMVFVSAFLTDIIGIHAIFGQSPLLPYSSFE